MLLNNKEMFVFLIVDLISSCEKSAGEFGDGA